MSTPDSGRLGDYDLPPSKVLQKTFDDMTGHKLPRDLLTHKLGGLKRSYGHSDKEKEIARTAFDALTTIMKTKPALRDDVVNYIASRVNLHKPFREHLRDTDNGALIGQLEHHKLKRALL